MSPAVCPGKHDGRLNRLFRLNGGNGLVGSRSLAVCLVRHDGRLSSLFRIVGNFRGSRSLRASLALAALHSDTILSQRMQMRLSIATESAPTGKEDKIFSMRRASAAATTAPVETTGMKKTHTRRACQPALADPRHRPE